MFLPNTAVDVIAIDIFTGGWYILMMCAGNDRRHYRRRNCR